MKVILLPPLRETGLRLGMPIMAREGARRPEYQELMPGPVANFSR